MKIVMLASASSIHTVRWANSLANEGYKVHLISQHARSRELIAEVCFSGFKWRGKLGYFFMLLKAKKIIDELNPEIVHAHYATGYGLLGTLIGRRPLIISVWGSDIYEFPHKSLIHLFLLRFILLRADSVCSTSNCMAEEISRVYPSIARSRINVIPFGINLKIFNPSYIARPSDKLIIGTVKGMDNQYGIDTLIESFALLSDDLRKSHPALAGQLRLHLVGDGSEIDKLKGLAFELGVADRCKFLGPLSEERVVIELSKMSIFVALSRSESFGVAVLEAGAMGLPVVVSDAPGLKEVVRDDVTGIVVNKNDPSKAASAIKKLVMNDNLRHKMGEEGRKRVVKLFEHTACISKMDHIYQEINKENS